VFDSPTKSKEKRKEFKKEFKKEKRKGMGREAREVPCQLRAEHVVSGDRCDSCRCGWN
jgi:hypothetical protein